MMRPAAHALLAATMILAVAAVLPAQAPSGDDESVMRNTVVTRWADPNTRPETYEEYLAARKLRFPFDGPFAATLDYQSPPAIYAGKPHVDVLLETSLAKAVATELDRYIADLEIDGWGVKLFRCEGGTPTEVRAFLQKRYAADAIRACLMVGDLPVAYYEMSDDFNNRYSQFPTDLYYMDLNGTFGDADNDGRFDSHGAGTAGDQRPEIAIGRLRASPLAGTWGTEDALLNAYFRKVHHYRIGKLNAPKRALAFQDDDWYYMSTYQERAWTTVKKVTDKYVTTATNYKSELGQGYESVIVCAHSSPSVHAFKVPSSSGGSVSNSTLWALEPPCLFYNLFACSNARYTSTRYMGGAYVFVKDKGLIAVGTTKTGAMLYFSDYYTQLGRQATFGEAFRYWLEKRYPYSLGDRRWHYGMTLLGDPTLRKDRALLTASYKSLGKGKGFTIDFDLQGRPDHAAFLYMIVAGASGTSPGGVVPGARLPLNLDLFSWFFLFSLNGPTFPEGMGNLDGRGDATPKYTWNAAVPPAVLNQTLHFTALMLEPRTLQILQATPVASVKVEEPE